MARKTLSAFDVATAEFIAMTEFMHVLAQETYDAQDAETQEAIDKIVSTLKAHSTGSSLKVTEEHIDMALFVTALEVVKDLALLDIRVANFTIPDDACLRCGEPV